ncbi:MAG: hypothetical protein KDD47_28545 [Acidobacteria bacterium]|nr:hypothetical protein [Acidobacteriota bacterium]
MVRDHEIRAFRYSETLTLGVYHATDTWPRESGETLAGRLRLVTPAISDSILDGCSWSGPSARSAWRTAARLLERLSDLLDQADRLGLLDPESALELLEAQSGALMEILFILEEEPSSILPLTSERHSTTKTEAENELRRAA